VQNTFELLSTQQLEISSLKKLHIKAKFLKNNPSFPGSSFNTTSFTE